MTKKVYSNIYDLAHGFFYTPFDGIERRTASASYINRVFYSYYTTIGYFYEDKNGEKTLFYSWDSMSNTTAHHISALVNACPFKRLRVPFKYDWRITAWDTNEAAKQIASLFFERIENDIKAKAKYTQKANREYSSDLLSMATDFVKITGAKIKNLKKYQKYLEKVLNADNIKKAAQKARQAAAKKAKQTKNAIERFKKTISKKPVLENINKYIFDFDFSKATDVQRMERDLFIQSFEIDRPSFVTVDTASGEVKTSQHLRFKIADILPLLRMWAHHHNIVGLNLKCYTVLQNNEKLVKIGCHSIPRENIQALADTLL